MRLLSLSAPASQRKRATSTCPEPGQKASSKLIKHVYSVAIVCPDFTLNGPKQIKNSLHGVIEYKVLYRMQSPIDANGGQEGKGQAVGQGNVVQSQKNIGCLLLFDWLFLFRLQWFNRKGSCLHIDIQTVPRLKLYLQLACWPTSEINTNCFDEERSYIKDFPSKWDPTLLLSGASQFSRLCHKFQKELPPAYWYTSP